MSISKPSQPLGSLKSLTSEDVAKLATLSTISKALNTSYEPDVVLWSVLEAMMVAMEADRGFVRLYDQEKKLVQEIALDKSVEPWGHRFRFTYTLLEECLTERKPVLMLDAEETARSESVVIAGIRSVMLHPLVAQNDLLGVVYLDSLMQAGRFKDNDLRLLGIICEMVAVALDRSRKAGQVIEANQKLDASAEETIYKLSRAAEYRDDEGGEHLRRVSQYCEAVARQLGLDEALVEAIKVASLLHDVGKVGIPDSILLKPGRFTDYEREVMKQHTVIGANILANSQSAIIQVAEEIALSHHEKWDGSGYPKGLSGERIPLTGRIVAVADVFDALTTARRYKAPYSLDDAFDLITRESGSHFDPGVARAFLSIRPLVEQIRQENQPHDEEAPPTDPAEVLQETFGDSQTLLEVLRSTVADLARKTELDEASRATALKATSALTGLLGSLGNLHGVQSVRRVEAHLKKPSLGSESAPRLAELVAEIEKSCEEPNVEADHGARSLLVVEPDPYQRESLILEAMNRGLTIVEAEDAATAKASIQMRTPDLVIFEAAAPGADELLDWLCAERADLPLVILSSEGEFSRRLAVARRTSAIYLHKPVPASAVFDEIEERFGGQAEKATRILALDDDRLILTVIRRVLERRGFQVQAITDPMELWSTISDNSPDLLLLDLEMPTVSGFDICRVLRSDLNFRHLPIIVLTAHQDFDNYERALEAGADDVITKPLEPARLVSRIRSRLARNQALRLSTTRDPLTGLMDLRAALKTGAQLFALAVRNGLTFSVCSLHINDFDEITLQLGWRKAAELLRQVAQVLEHNCRTEDILVRQGHHRFLLFLHGITREGSEKRVESLNARLAQRTDGVKVECSAEIASYPDDGTNLNALLEKLDAT
ncbi:MAG: response regulator [Candidatus Eremiobacteraeota bacterium]|nr:response regulator [Candidatus Eremiobacteraeota bacterium]